MRMPTTTGVLPIGILGNTSERSRTTTSQFVSTRGMPDAYHNRGIAYDNLGQYQRAIQDYDQAIAMDPRNAKAYATRGIAEVYLHRDAEAKSDFKRAFEIDPNLKEIVEPLIKEAKAKREGKQAGKVEESATAAYFNGLMLQFTRQYREAIPHYDKAIRLDPRYADAYFNRGLAYAELGQYERAIQDYNDAIRLKPGDALAHDSRGFAYAGLGRTSVPLRTTMAPSVSIRDMLGPTPAEGSPGSIYAETLKRRVISRKPSSLIHS